MTDNFDNNKSNPLIEGTITKVTFKNSDNNFCIVKAEKSNGEYITVTGIFPPGVDTGFSFNARGQWTTHPKYGEQFQAKSITETRPTDESSIKKYLGSGNIKGLGPVIAERIVNKYGKDSFKILDNEADRLLEIEGIGSAKLEEIKNAWLEKTAFREVFLFFEKYGIPTHVSKLVFEKYREKSIEKIMNNPYLLIYSITGVGFLTADKIAQKLGIEERSPRRLHAALYYQLKTAGSDGHTFLPEDQLIIKTADLLGFQDTAGLYEALKTHPSNDIIIVDGRVYTSRLYNIERELANTVAYRAKQNSKQIDFSSLEREANFQIGDSSVFLNEDQKNAIKLACSSSIFILTGGPGCGKTTTIRALISVFRREGVQFKLAAPTGKAAQRMSEVSSHPASTIHRLLKYDPFTSSFQHNKEDPIDTDAVIIDEVSMLDIELANHLFNGISNSTKVILVGDADQLPSVGPGLFLEDVLKSEMVPSVKLSRVYRQSGDSEIIDFAYSINESIVPEDLEDSANSKELFFIPQTEPEKISKTTIEIFVNRIPQKFGIKRKDISILSPMNKGPLGVVSLNKQIQEVVIPDSPSLAKVVIGDKEFRIGDRVCQRVNNYNITDEGVFNGEQGTITAINSVAGEVTVKLWDGRDVIYNKSNLNQLSLSYALTVHRCQGNETDAIILVVHPSHYVLLSKKLIYTAVTRAKKLLIVIGSKKALKSAIRGKEFSNRHSYLKNLIIENMK